MSVRLDDVWLFLKPSNDRAKEVLDHTSNSHLISTYNDERVICIGQNQCVSEINALATLGRGQSVDIFIGSRSISKIQCSFELEPGVEAVMLYDRSRNQTTQIFGRNVIPFEHGRIRKVVIPQSRKVTVGLGGACRDLFLFDVLWNRTNRSFSGRLHDRQLLAEKFSANPRLARTIDEAETDVPSRRDTRIHTPGSGTLKMRWYTGAELGAGAFGTVYQGMDADTGRIMAVKVLDPASSTANTSVKREIELLARLNHPNIVEYIAANCSGPSVEIFMGLMDTNLHSLIERGARVDADMVFQDMLKALDYLASNDIIHRDIKPENIFCNATPSGGYHSRLGDFGLGNCIAKARTCVGSPLFMAPEIYSGGRQSHKSDVYSLFVTMMWVINVRGFREALFGVRHYLDVHAVVSAVLDHEKVRRIRTMAAPEQDSRPSAAEILVKFYNGSGLATLESPEPVARNEAESQVAPVSPSPIQVPHATGSAMQVPIPVPQVAAPAPSAPLASLRPTPTLQITTPAPLIAIPMLPIEASAIPERAPVTQRTVPAPPAPMLSPQLAPPLAPQRRLMLARRTTERRNFLRSLNNPYRTQYRVGRRRYIGPAASGYVNPRLRDFL